MSIVSILVFASQAARRLAIKAKNKAVTAVSSRIEKVEAEQFKVEEHRSDLMIKAHNSFYSEHDAIIKAHNEAIAKLKAKTDKSLARLNDSFAENKRTIALTHQAASNQLKGELVALRSELDHLTK